MTDSKKTNSPKRVQKSTVDDEFPVPPDGGWGWVVTFSSFMVSVLVDGVCFSFGIFFTKFMDYFQESKMKTSWVGSVLNGTYLVLGPIVGSLVTKFGCRNVALVGAIIAATSFFISSFSPNIEVLTVTYGLMGGTGLGFMYLPAIVMVGYYFEKRRALATGIACCGSGIGAFVFAPLCEFLLEEYNWQGATWILSAIVLNGLIFSAFYRPVSNLNKDVLERKGVNSENTCDTDEFYLVNAKCFPVMNPDAESLKACRMHPWELTNSPVYRCKSVDIPTINTKIANNDSDRLNMEISRMAHSHHDIADKKVKLEYYNPLQRKDIFYSGSISNLKMHQNVKLSQNYINKLNEEQSKGRLSNESEGGDRGTCGFLKKHVDLSLLSSPKFLVYGTSCFLCMAGFFVPFMYIPPLAQDLGISAQKAAFLISIIGIVNTVGRVLTGYISDQVWADCLLINNIALIIGGIATILVPFYTNFGILAAYCCVFGLSIAVFVSLRSIIMVELMGLEKLTSAFGLVIMCQGLSSFIGAPIAGAISDSTGNYDAAFYMAGSVLAMAGIICLPLRRIASWEDEKKYSEGEITPMISNAEIKTSLND
ncbi:monocarboxylate transporter 12 [Patella vulgata]|uniref:monocarboxylate transporter 12 n=1 Tax=Patella vulgata TaxID=6465 RepID=UPI0021807BA3|nr:monocarboxylate transporter 12 [Patella vulgata]